LNDVKPIPDCKAVRVRPRLSALVMVDIDGDYGSVRPLKRNTDRHFTVATSEVRIRTAGRAPDHGISEHSGVPVAAHRSCTTSSKFAHRLGLIESRSSGIDTVPTARTASENSKHVPSARHLRPRPPAKVLTIADFRSF